jgi:hypothetical protein
MHCIPIPYNPRQVFLSFREALGLRLCSSYLSTGNPSTTEDNMEDAYAALALGQMPGEHEDGYLHITSHNGRFLEQNSS